MGKPGMVDPGEDGEDMSSISNLMANMSDSTVLKAGPGNFNARVLKPDH